MAPIIKTSSWAPFVLGCVATIGAGLAPPTKPAHAEPEPPGGHHRFEDPIVPFDRTDPRPLPDFPLNPIVPSAALGYLPGAAAVGDGGAATYTIPLAVPPGVRGMQPNLSLLYSSKGESGVLGLGWSLVGASQIERCRKTLRADGVAAGYDGTSEDALCLNGRRLVQVGTAPEGPEYRTEASPFDRIVHHLSTDTFEMKSADGRISTYKPLSLPRHRPVDPNLDGDPGNDVDKLTPWRVT